MRLHVIYAVMKRNVASYFSGVLGYLFIVVFVVAATAMAFTPQFFANNVASLDQLNEVFPLLLLFIVPAITMGAWADERKSGTDELLFTLPARDIEILLGKYLAVLAVYTVALAFSMTQLVVLAFYSNPDWWLLASTYLGYWLSGATLLSAGMFASGLARSTTVAFVLGVLVCAVPVFVADIPGLVRLAPIVAELSLSEQFREFTQGTIPLNGLIYFASLTAFMLYLNLVLITRRHWAGNQQVNMGLQYALRTVALVVILASFNLMARASTDVLGLRVDMTADGLYTLSDTTQSLLKSLDDDHAVEIHAFISPEVPREFVPVRKRLIGMLRQYERIGAPRVALRLLDTPPFSEAAEEADNRSIIRRAQTTEQGGRQELIQFYLGVAVTSANGETLIPTFEVDSPVEYELTRAIATVADRHRRTVGILDTDAKLTGGVDFASGSFQSLPRWGIVDELEKQYKVARIHPDSPYDEQDGLRLFEADAGEKHADDVTALDGGRVPERLQNEFSKQNVELSRDARVETVTAGKKWRVVDDAAGFHGTILHKEDRFFVYRGLDVLLAPLPSSLSDAQMDRLVSEIEGGLPALIFDDPAPITIGLQHAPMVAKRPAGGMMAGMQMPAVPRADNGLATRLMTLLGLNWTGRWSFSIDGGYAAGLDAGKVPATLPAVYAAHDLRLRSNETVDVVEKGKKWTVEATHRNTDASVKTTIEKKGTSLVVSGEPEVVVVWEGDNPHPKIEDLLTRIPEYVFISTTSGAKANAFAADSPITNGLKETLALFPGRVRKVEGDRLEHKELMITGRNSGEMLWSDMVTPGNFLSPAPSIADNRPHYQDDFNHVLAMRVRAKAPAADADAAAEKKPRLNPRRGIDVVYVADLDFISNYVLFTLPIALREQFDTEVKLDNLAFVFNAIDLLAGDDEKIELRKRQHRPRPLTVIQDRIKQHREERQKAEEEAIKRIDKERRELQKRMEAAQQQLGESSGLDAFAQLQRLVTTAEAERRRYELRLKDIEDERQQIIDRLKGEERRQIEADQARIRWQAVLLPPIPAILLGTIILSIRLSRERSTIQPGRMRT